MVQPSLSLALLWPTRDYCSCWTKHQACHRSYRKHLCSCPRHTYTDSSAVSTAIHCAGSVVIAWQTFQAFQSRASGATFRCCWHTAQIIMVALWNRAGHYIFVRWFLLSIFFCFLAYSQPSQIGCLPYFRTWCGLSANLGCRSETCCRRLAENTGSSAPKNRHLCTIAQLCWALSSHFRN